MSVLPLFLMALCVTSFTACSDDDDEGGNGGNNSIVGTWVQESVEETYYGEVTNTTTFVFNSNGQGTEQYKTVMKYEDGRPTVTNEQDPEPFSYSYDSESQVLTLMYNTRYDRYTAIIMGNRMLLQDEDGNYDFTRK